ncbi:hypothetical protein MNEG_1304 [Monoraphidium neglectum]|uniref:Uncharacterized protein n=1 Tax=Monoraphidium neglectum TaxID=145388 RepID=A0A0D2N2Q0_9CHLO|nr:hypothetical protein MNEG_1304 [Monoraphidium neglectum]KIZ06652.1 hypothetical protein MNEG_1304 [Monoraphidium neglectum]|eukprot:XP_013905671.1 hypothetical protein MNEG_1304 [Monoraphidium neglectum]
MQHLPRNVLDAPAQGPDWGAALGNAENAKLAVAALRDMLGDAVFLDEEAFAGAATMQLYQQRLQAQVRRMRELEAVAEALRAEVSMKDEALAAARDSVEAANTRVRDMQGELDANAAVFELHYREIMLKNEEIERLKAVIEGLGGGGGDVGAGRSVVFGSSGGGGGPGPSWL